MKSYLNFENDIKELESELEKLKDPYNQEGLSEVDTNKISTIQSEIDGKLNEIYSNLDSWQIALVARHEDRPKSKFFIDNSPHVCVLFNIIIFYLFSAIKNYINYHNNIQNIYLVILI